MACWRMLDQSTASSVAGILSLPPFGIPDSEPMLRTVFSLSLCVSALDGGAAAPLCLRELAEYRPAVPEPEPTPTLETERCG